MIIKFKRRGKGPAVYFHSVDESGRKQRVSCKTHKTRFVRKEIKMSYNTRSLLFIRKIPEIYNNTLNFSKYVVLPKVCCNESRITRHVITYLEQSILQCDALTIICRINSSETFASHSTGPAFNGYWL